MSEPEAGGTSVRYFCTAGSGMEPFVVEEVKRKLAGENVCQMTGKVLFSTRARISRVRRLKAAERLFLLVKHDSPVKLPAHTRPGKAAAVLRSRLLGDKSLWTDAVITWRRLQGELSGSAAAVKRVSSAPEEAGKLEEGSERRDLEFGKSPVDHREEESGNRRLRCEESGARTLEGAWQGKEKMSALSHGDNVKVPGRKRKLDDQEESVLGTDEKKQRTSERKTEDGNERLTPAGFDEDERNGPKSETDSRGQGSGLDRDAERSAREIDDLAEDGAEGNMEHERTAGGGEQEVRQHGGPNPPGSPASFRISCKSSGCLARCLGGQEVSRVIGGGLSRLLGWRPDLKNPEVEVNVFLSDDVFLLGMVLTRLPLASRSYMKNTGLRSTVAWAMASLASIQPGDLVVDPMCGAGTILIEAAQEHEEASFLGLDNDGAQLQKAGENVAFAELGQRVSLLRASSTAIPLPSGAADALVCDLPFGRKFGTKTNMAANLPLILTEMERVLRVGGTLVLLLSPQLSFHLKKLLEQRDSTPACNPPTEPPPTSQNRPGSSSSPPKQRTVEETSVLGQRPPPGSSLKHQVTLRVSLGAIDGLIHKYIKTLD